MIRITVPGDWHAIRIEIPAAGDGQKALVSAECSAHFVLIDMDECVAMPLRRAYTVVSRRVAGVADMQA